MLKVPIRFGRTPHAQITTNWMNKNASTDWVSGEEGTTHHHSPSDHGMVPKSPWPTKQRNVGFVK